MAQQSYPFDAGAGAAVNEAQWQAMARRFRQTGVIGGSLNQLAVSADGSALAVSVATGDAFVEGFFYRNDSALALTIAAANATNPRIDTVAVRLDRGANSVALAVVTGVPAASPVAPALSQTDSLYELPLSNVTVPAAAGVIVAGNVTDRRSITQTFDSAAYVAKAAVAQAAVAASETTTSSSFVDLATVGPAVTLTTGARALVMFRAALENSNLGGYAQMSFAVSGATARAAQGAEALSLLAAVAGQQMASAQAVIVTGLTPGSNTFTAKYQLAVGGTARFTNRQITVIPLD